MALQFGVSGDVITWSVTGLPSSAVGHSVTLELNGFAAANATVPSNGCLSSSFVLCLNPGVYTGVALSQGYPDSNSVAYNLTAAPTCASPVGPAITGTAAATGSGGVATPSSSTSSSSGALAFTGANVVKWLLVAAALILLGMAVTRSSRKRRHARAHR